MAGRIKEILKLLGFTLLVMFLIAGVAEAGLRLAGHQPGVIVDRAPFARDADTLYLYKDYVADEYGIQKFSPQGRAFVCNSIANGDIIEEGRYILLNMIIDDYIQVWNGEADNAFTRFIQRLKRLPADRLSDVEQAYLEYVRCPVNQDGFRSIPFRRYSADAPSVLLLGDSHTYGAEASNITNSFADELAARGYIVYNTGIVATDPAQYLAVAQRYIPILQPDYVIVSFCLNNDVVYFKRKPEPYQLVYYPTNVENLMACPDGIYLRTPEEAYNLIKSECYIPEHSFFNRLMSKTVLTTKCWMLFRKLGWLTVPPQKQEYYSQIAGLRSETPVSEYYMQEIRNLCRQYDARFILAVIPDGDDLAKRPPDIPGLFTKVKYYVPENTTPADRAEGGHFNDTGYRKYAAFLDSLMRISANSVSSLRNETR